jgi:1-acyl-sn-glycerol-3-phosphate acyltransferase
MGLRDMLRGARFIGYYFGGLPLGNLAFLRAYERDGIDAARRVFLERAERALEMSGATVEVRGKEHIPEGPCVFVYNEASPVDLVLLHRHLYEHADVGAAAEIFKRVPWMSEAAEKMRVVIFERGNRESADRMLDQVTTWVREGGRMAMGGEGRLMKDGSVGRFKRGGCLVAIRAGVPVVPVACGGAPDLMPVGSLRLRKGRLSLSFGEPMPTTGLVDDDAPELAQRVRAEVVRMREAAHPG